MLTFSDCNEVRDVYDNYTTGIMVVGGKYNTLSFFLWSLLQFDSYLIKNSQSFRLGCHRHYHRSGGTGLS